MKPILWMMKVAIYLIAAFVPFFFEHTSEIFESGTCTAEEHPFKESVFGRPFDYQHLARPGYSGVSAHLVQIVAIKEGREPAELFQSSCRRRLFLAKLLDRLESANRQLVVIDYSFPPSECAAEDEELRRVLARANKPIVLGRATSTRDEYLRLHPNAGNPKFGEACLIESQQMGFGGASTPANVKTGLLRLNQETSRVPLGWPVYKLQDRGIGELVRMPTLALVAADEYERMSSHTKNERLQQLLAIDEDPFTVFMTEKEIPTTPAIDVLCEKGASVGNAWSGCESPGNIPLAANPIVLIGEDSTRDQHGGSPLGTVPGVVLQANYIESLLGDRFLSPFSLRKMLIVNLLWVGVVELAFFWLGKGWALFVSYFVYVLMFAGFYLATLKWGMFAPVWSLTILVYPLVRLAEDIKATARES